MPEYVQQRPYYYPGVLVIQIVNGVLGIVQFLLVLRLILEMLGASTSSAFVAEIYAITDSLIRPFAGAFSNLYVAGFSIDLSVILAMIGYSIIAWIVVRLLSFLFTVLFAI